MLKCSWFFSHRITLAIVDVTFISAGVCLLESNTNTNTNNITWKPLPVHLNSVHECAIKRLVHKKSCAFHSTLIISIAEGFQFHLTKLANYILEMMGSLKYVASPLNSRIICFVTTVPHFIAATHHLRARLPLSLSLSTVQCISK